MKKCCRCGEEKPLVDFAVASRNRDGLHSYCRPCMSAYRAERTRTMTPEQREARKRSQKAYEERNPGAAKVHARRYRESGRAAEVQAAWRAKFPEKQRQYYLKTRHNITVAEYEQMVVDQDGLCAICDESPGEGDYLRVDHCHDKGHRRGLLCHNCNVALGHFKDDPELLLRAVTYLRRP